MTIFRSRSRDIIWGLIVAGSAVAVAKYASMSEAERCFTESCREAVALDQAAKEAIVDDRLDRELERSDAAVKESEQNIREINDAIGEVCRQHPASCNR